MIERVRTDARSAVRALRSTPGPVVWAVVMLAIAVGLNLAMFGLIDRALLSPPAHVAEPREVFTLGFEPPGPPSNDTGRARMTTTSYPAFASIRNEVSAAADVAAWQRASTAVVVDSREVSADVMMVSGGYFALLGARPHL